MSRPFLFAAVALLAWGCANVKPPTGGAQDFDPPVLDSAATIPAYGQTNFRGQKLVFPFNEDIAAQQAGQKLIFNPALDQRVNATVYRNQLEIRLTEPLSDSTTYTLEFWSVVEDLTEKNPVPILQWTFSTGPQIDSLSLRGKVVSNDTKEPLAGALVALYPVESANPLVVRNEAARFLTKTDERGGFTFAFLPPGEFWLFAYQDENDSRRCEEKEEVALWPEPVVVGETDKLELASFKVASDSLRYLSGKQDGQVVRLSFSRPIATVSPVDSLTATYFPSISAEEPTEVVLHLSKDEPSERIITLSITDESGQTLVLEDTVRLREVPTPKAPTAQLVSNSFAPGDSLTLRFSQPIVSWDPDSIWIQVDSITRIERLDTVGQWSSDRMTWTLPIHAAWKNGFALVIRDTCFQSGFGQSTSSDSLLVTPRVGEDFATIQGRVETTLPAYWIDLVDEKGETVRTCYGCTTFRWAYLSGGTFRVRVRIDENSDGRYETGSVRDRLTPEPSYFLPKEHFVRANWTLADLVLSF